MRQEAEIHRLPVAKISRQANRIRERAELWYDKGYSWETAVVAATLSLHIDNLDRRMRRLEGKKCKNSPQRRRIRGNVLLLREPR